MEERRLRTDDRAQSLVYEQLMATAFIAHPYRAPTVGWMSDLEHMTWRDARDWYDRWYAPNNATIVVVGDVDPPEVFALAELFRRHQGEGAARAQAAGRARATRHPAHSGQGAGGAPVLVDGLSRADLARRRERLGALCARNAGGRARWPRRGAAEQRAGAQRENRQCGRRRLRQHAARPRHVHGERGADRRQNRRRARTGAAARNRESRQRRNQRRGVKARQGAGRCRAGVSARLDLFPGPADRLARNRGLFAQARSIS